MKSNTAPLARAAQTPAKKGQNTTNQAQIEIQTWNTYNVHGQLVKSTITTGPEDENPQITTRAYDSLGRLVATTAPNGFITRQESDVENRTAKTTSPSNSVRITESYLDGQQKRVTEGNDLVQEWDYGVDAETHETWTENRQKGSKGDSVVSMRTLSNFLGQTPRTERPGPKDSGELLVSLQSYDTWGRAFASQPNREDEDGNLTPLQAASLVVYDELGGVLYSGQDVDGDGELKPASMDRISQSDTTYERDPDGHLWLIRRSWIWPKDNDATRILVSETHSRSGNLGEVDEEHGQLITLTKSFRPTKRKTGLPARSPGDSRPQTITRTYRNRDTSTQTTITETAKGHQTIQVTVGGLLHSVTTKDASVDSVASVVQYQYDARGRRIATIDSRTGKSTIEYDPVTGFVTKTTDADNNATTYTYYGQGEPGAGKVKSITNPHGKTQWFRYNQRGQKVMTWGLTDYPIIYQYNAFGELYKMHTTHVDPFVADWLVQTNPEPPTLEQWFARCKTHITTWIRDPFTRQVIRKEYADRKGNNFVYSVDGKLIEETSARGAKTVREYDQQTGELARITTSLNGETTEITYERNRLGNVIAVTDSGGRRTFERDEFGREIAEILPNGQRIERDYEDDSGQLAVVRLFEPDGEDAVYQADYSYNPNETLAAAESKDGRFDYSYVEGAPNLLASVKGPVAHTTYGYEENRNLVTDVHNQLNEADKTVSRFAYTNDPTGRRSSVKISGPNAENPGWDWGYNDRSELLRAEPKLKTENFTLIPTTTSATAKPLPKAISLPPTNPTPSTNTPRSSKRNENASHPNMIWTET